MTVLSGHAGRQSVVVPRRRDASGFTLIEVLVALLVLTLIMLAVGGITVALMMQFSNGSDERLAEGTTAQWASMTFARDVQGASGVAAECAPGTGNRLVTFRSSDSAPAIEYRIQTNASRSTLYRVSCGSPGKLMKVVSGLNTAPTVTCDDSACVSGTNPRVVTLHVSRSSKFNFTLDGVRRTTDGNIDPAAVPAVAPPFISLGGLKPLTITGAGSLTIKGDAYINNPGATAATIANSASLLINGNLVIQQGTTAGPVLTATGNPVIHVGGNGPAPSEMNVCGWCDIKINGSGPGTTQATVPDPFRFIPAPDTTSVPVRTTCPLQGTVYVCQPGIYTGTFPPTSPGDAQFRIESGNYILRGGFALLNGRGIQSNGGVMFYLESGALTVQGDTQLTVSAQTSGTYAGILFFQPATNTSVFNISNGGRVSALNGAIYAPAATSVNLSSGAGTLTIRQMIGQNISITNSGAVIVGGF